MSDDRSSLPLALIYETTGGFDGEIATSLTELGWNARVLARDVGALSKERGDLWVVQLAPAPVESLDFLQALCRLRDGAALLVVLEVHQVRAYSREVARLLRNWPAPADFLVWPHTPEELHMRVARLAPIQRQGTEAGAVYEWGGLRLDTASYRVSFDGKAVELTPTEFRILLELVKGSGQIALSPRSPGQGQSDGRRQNAALKTLISRLRDKLEEAGMDPRAIRTIRGVGYRLEMLSTTEKNPR